MIDDKQRAVSIFLIDDDRSIRSQTIDYLNSNNFSTKGTSSGKESVEQIRQEEPDLVILDLRLGLEDGFDLLRELRSRSDIPVITTCSACNERDIVMGLEIGADDHVSKPFYQRELLARVRAVLRRYKKRNYLAKSSLSDKSYRFGGWRFEPATRLVMDLCGTCIKLSRTECAFLLAFVGSPQRILSRLYLQHVTRVREDMLDRSIDVAVLRLRRKLKSYPSATSIIRTERGIGYVFTLPVEIQSMT